MHEKNSHLTNWNLSQHWMSWGFNTQKKISYYNSSGFPDSSVGKESTCNAEDPGLIPGLGRSPQGIGYPLQYSWASLVAQLVKNLSTMQETWVRFLGWEDLLEKGKATHCSILAWRIPWTVARQAPRSVGFSRQEYWRGWPFPSPRELASFLP